MSVLRFGTLQSSSGTQAVTQDRLYRGSVTAWVNFNGTGTIEIRDNYNISSLTDNGVGDYTVNFTNALSNSNYAVNLTHSASFGGGNVVVVSTNKTSAPFILSTSAVRLSSGADNSVLCVVISGGY